MPLVRFEARSPSIATDLSRRRYLSKVGSVLNVSFRLKFAKQALMQTLSQPKQTGLHRSFGDSGGIREFLDSIAGDIPVFDQLSVQLGQFTKALLQGTQQGVLVTT